MNGTFNTNQSTTTACDGQTNFEMMSMDQLEVLEFSEMIKAIKKTV